MKNLINNANRKLGRKHSKGFSLVELLVVIAVIGVIAAIAIPAMSNVFTNSREAKARKNAQNIASTYSAARAAGVSFTGTTAAAIATELNTGVEGKGTFKGSKFQVLLDTKERDAAVTYLGTPADGILPYTGTGSDTAKD